MKIGNIKPPQVNPGGSRKDPLGEGSNPFRKLATQLLFGFIVLFLLMGALSALFGNTPAKEITLSELASQINDGKVEYIHVKEQGLEIKLKDGTIQQAKKEEGQLTQSLINLGVPAEKIAASHIEIKNESGLSFFLGAILPLILPFILFGLFLWFLMGRAQQGSMQAFSFGKAKARLFNGKNNKERVTFKDVAGVDEAKEELKEVVEFLKVPRKFLDIGARIPRGVLLMGSPGTGKTLLARAVAGEANVPFYHMSGSEFVEMFVGVGASRVRDLFETAKNNAPAIIFIDEIDAVGRLRGAGLGGGHDEREQTLNQILVEMDGFERDTNVIIIAATNRPDVLDPALLRPGRFDRRIILEEPDIKAREEILKIHAQDKKTGPDINLRSIAERTPGFSGADLANLINEAAILAARRNKFFVAQIELIESIDKIMLGPERKSHALSIREKKITAYHEGGHALVAASIKAADPVHKVSIVSRGFAGGYTIKLPTEDKRLHTRSEFIADLAIMLGGYTAEEIIFKELTTGASNDLQKATELSRKLITEFGMSKALGPVTFIEKNELVFLGRELGEQRHYSEETAKKIDHEIQFLINEAHKTAREILSRKLSTLHLIAQKLIEKETLERAEFEELIKSVGKKVSSTAKRGRKDTFGLEPSSV
ncbi:MAG: ATP-dependent zinc metalloprotease FtsH [Parcubacteria group bacterium GW2011_GWA2_40_8]|nr:MAG: ATP-dependent zinc metalloprotease FtsH [Parcubacteria group bacterium GW2011_GWB1_40_14]KKR78419.1 MAG: ATP-dependent zinc metalloprotease FtsH [Parcubacteria group bacterium GW2011_GWA2_40_8]